MHLPSIFTLLATLSSAERADFSVFLQLPSLKVKSNVQQLYAAWQAYTAANTTSKFLETNPQAPINQLTKNQLWEQAFPDRAFSPTMFSKYIGDLKTAAEQFLMFLRLQAQPNLQQNFLFAELCSRELHDFVAEKLPIHASNNALKPLFDSSDYTQYWQATDQIDKYYESQRQRTNKDKFEAEAASEWLDAHYVLHKLRYICYIDNQNTVQASEIEALGSSFLFKILAERPHFTTTHPLINAYFLLAQRPRTRLGLEAVWAFLKTHEKDFGSDDCDSLYSFLLNCCTYTYNHHIDDVSALTFLMYQHCLEHNVFKIKNNLPFIYKNVIKIGCTGITKGQLSVQNVTDFAHHYHTEAINEATFKYCNALIAFHAADYREAIFLLAQTNFNDYHNRFDTLCLELRALYAHQQTDTFMIHNDRFRKQLARVTKFPAENVVIYERFRSLLFSLYTLKNGGKKNWKTVFAKKLAQRKTEGTVLNYDWFVVQI